MSLISLYPLCAVLIPSHGVTNITTDLNGVWPGPGIMSPDDTYTIYIHHFQLVNILLTRHRILL